MSHPTLTLCIDEVMAGSHVDHVAMAMAQMSRVLGCRIRATFNETTLEIGPDELPSDAVARWARLRT